MLPLVLLPTEVDTVPKEGYCKRNAVGAFGSGGGKVILTLLTEVIAFYVGLTMIDVRWSGLQWLLTGAVRGSSGFEDRPEDLLQIFFCIFSNKRLDSRRVNWGLIMDKLRRGWRSFGGLFSAKTPMASDRSHPDSRSGAE